MTLIGVIGTGTMGSNHVRVLSGMKNVEIAISDVDDEKRRDVVETYGVKHFSDHRELLKEKLDGVIIATPSPFHRSIFSDCIKKGVNILVEKPIAETVADAQAMIEMARDHDVTFTVGHVERFNPVVTEMKKLMNELGDVYLVNTVRAGPFPKRLYGNPGGVLVDLAVHDIDIINHLTGKMEEVYAHIIRSGRQEIYAKALFKIGNITGSSEFSWISPRRVRTIEIYGTNGMLHGDYHQQDLWFYENPDSMERPRTKNLFEEILLKGNITEGRVIKYPLIRGEPLKLELQSFLDTIKNGTEPIVKPEHALLSLRTALSILESAKEERPVRI